MYRIVQPLNNNAALVKNERGEQSVVMGIGLAFQKKKGDIVNADKIEKIFSLKSSESKDHFLMLLKDIPLDFISVTYQLIDQLSHQYDYPVQDYIYITLTTHIYCAYKAVLDQTYQENRLADMMQAYPVEYQMAKEALSIFRQKILRDFPEDELGRIALHFINAKGNKPAEEALKAETLQMVLASVEKELAANGILRTKENSKFYDRLMIHLTYFIRYSDKEKDSTSSLEDMGATMQIAYPKAYRLGTRIHDLITTELGMCSNEGEKLYIVLHIQRLL
ncbi:PRD domain-containing protein [Streptococcus sp. zg-86]|uniref:PRD domain-containing protein n=1 Tax=Streptococcus zhangguiae TaxID=2664091 RepID=A0A6I4RJD6_9STRE|nr:MULTISPECIES: PRD domain-containing protein [unclassified Streptococcus]MTB64613.1 PRD domain-containing protein [Streptococcus sp. zg-86]MTB90923.1 PRD domain-containing protein [Streptococcus sp. zg-36]MWV56653.1 PRD domain-containing protein [Streptococcus sp. zg-70]QTH48612.1 PRD domain-containing protein [Streptococcus sp. zg-86]